MSGNKPVMSNNNLMVALPQNEKKIIFYYLL